MACRNCGVDNRPEAKFCKSCGKTLVLTKKCPSCAEEILYEAKKCRYCQEILVTKSVKGIENASMSAPVYDPIEYIAPETLPAADQIDEAELKKACWSGFFLNIFWCFSRGFYGLGFACLIPYVNLGVVIYLLIKGNKIDWEKNWDKGKEEYFRKRKAWDRAALITLLCTVPIIVFLIILGSMSSR